MTTIRGARERARAEVTAAIKDEARRRLAKEGAVKLSLRAVARELGMVSSALYRYFPSRDDLLTALIIDAFDAVGEAAESALAEGPSGDGGAADHVARWVAICARVRAWALAHPHEYALIHGSPVPDYTAPMSTTGPAARVALSLISVLRDAHEDGVLFPPAPAANLREEDRRLVDEFAPGLPPGTGVAIVAAWAQLYGLISFELFGQFNRVVEARDGLFAHATTHLAHDVGLST
ncbi:TetR/AcrR family transcriptional regulator [Streptomyces niveus]|uniref:TetR/AcrR family transcriptional regulator n=1 Tax=Streptomyces niveus TaxID=193462 RepID=UPI002E356192|nr:TetR/AcrR family transcriptional regulator [Streptomyces niveus]WTA57337.1 TetR/AcrR family transcriptional regulator [Streptomyces niveus]